MREYVRLGGNIGENRLSQLAPYIQAVIRAVQSRGISVLETRTDTTCPMQRVFYVGPLLVNVYHIRSRRQNRTFADVGKDRIREFAYSLFLQDITGFRQRIFYIPAHELLSFIGSMDKRQIVLPLKGIPTPIAGMPPDFTWLSYEGESGLKLHNQCPAFYFHAPMIQ